jgi:hypothetical protein
MGAVISFSLDLSKIDKSKIIQGKKGTYYPLTVFVNDQQDQYGNNVAVATGLTKEERQAGAKTQYVANGRVISTDGTIVAVAPQQESAPAANNTVEADFPF